MQSFGPQRLLVEFSYMYHNMQGLIKPKLKEGMQLNVNRQTAKCKLFLDIITTNNASGSLSRTTHFIR